MNSSELLEIRKKNITNYIRYNPTMDSSTHMWKRQLQQAGGSKPNHTFPHVAHSQKHNPISNRFTATTVGGNSDYQQTLLYKAGQETCGCGQEAPPLFQVIPCPNISTPTNPVLGVPRYGCDTRAGRDITYNKPCSYITGPDGIIHETPFTGKGMIHPS